MAIRTKVYSNSNGVSYTREVDGAADHAAVGNSTYFKDLSDGLVYYKNAGGLVINMFGAAISIVTTNLVYVSSTGLDGTGARNDIALPFLTLEAAVAAAVAGDTIMVYPGNYTVTTVVVNGIAKDGVDWYFYPNTIVNKASAGNLFDNTGFAVTCNVYGRGTFLVTGGGYIYSKTTALPITFEFESAICTNRCINNNVIDGDNRFMIRGYDTMETTGAASTVFSGTTVDVDISCPIIHNNNGATATMDIEHGRYVITAHSIQNFGAFGNAIFARTAGQFSVTASEVSIIRTTVNATINVASLNTLTTSGENVIMNGRVQNLFHTGGHCRAGNVSAFTGSGIGECWLSARNQATIMTFSGAAVGNYYLTLPVLTGTQNNTSRTYNVSGAGARVHLIGDARQINNVFNISAGTVYVKGNFYNASGSGTATPFNLTGTGRLVLTGTIEQADDTPCIIMTAGTTFISNGGTLVTSANTNAPIKVLGATQNIKVYSSGLNTNYTGHVLTSAIVASSRFDVTATLTPTSLSLNDGTGTEPFATPGAVSDAMVTALVGLINGSITLDLTATQVLPTDTFFTVVGDTSDVALVASALVNLTQTVNVTTGTFGVNDVVGGIIIQDVDVE